MDDQVMKKTQDTLGKIIKKPPLTEKLLNKPPFRFLHDIVTSVIKTTGFMKGLYADSELQSDNVKEKDAKMAFLQKAIDIVQLATGQKLSVKTSKIVAGHEPEKTNEFLQALAAAVSKKSKNDELVQKVLKGDTGSSNKKEKDREESSDRREKSAAKKDRDGEKRGKENKERDRSKDRERDKENQDEKRSKRQGDKKGSVDGIKDKSEKKETKAEDKPPKPEHTSNKDSSARISQDAAKQEGSDDEDEDDEQGGKIPRPSSAKGSRRRQREEEKRKREESNEDNDQGSRERPVPSQRPQRSARPSSARPAPPKPKKQADTVPEPEIRIGSGKPVAQVIVDNPQNSDDDDDDNFMVEEGGPPEPQPPPPQAEMNGDAEAEDGEHGGLVKKILETKKELEGGSQQASAKKVEIEKPVMSDVARRKEREMVMKEIDKLRGSIQTLTRSANPLGKIMDYVQEDLDSMQKELEKWKEENKEHAQALKREQGVTESSIEPLKGQLADLDQAIADQLILIAASKANILRNDGKISKMVGSVTKS